MEVFHDLDDLTPPITGWHIRVKVLRAFIVPLDYPNKMLGLVLANENGVRIEAMVGRHISHYYWKLMDEGQWFTILNFGLGYNSAVTKATNHQYQISFLNTTVVKKSLPVPEIPNGHFAPFSSIFEDSVDDDVLVDVVGAVFNVGTLENTAYNQGDINGYRIKFYIKDKDEHVLECVALKQEALDFELNYRIYGGGLFVAVLRWWKVYRYWDGPKNVRLCSNGSISILDPNPNIPEVDEIRAMLARTAEADLAGNVPVQAIMD